ncbi:hypothetical protein [Filimonas effusa]|uniref:Uncharacterized protein n=1 Tax=Filimonas effusa TaxID=2508721 RepID=A0A4Q1DCF4_9BACT|nr:hypothetical protein [Filimonas effusa]RXK87040.1 hypothetical protein ESB13_09720 [Filimonas effusa]
MPREKWSREVILDKCTELYSQWGCVPTSSLMKKKGYRKLAQSVPRYFKNFHNLYSEMGLISDKKPAGYWTKKTTVAELREFCQINQQLLETKSIFKLILEMKMTALTNAISKHGGLKVLNRKYKLGIRLRKKIWTKARVTRELKELHDAGHPVTVSNLLKLGKNTLVAAVSRLGTLCGFKKAAGIPVTKVVRWSDKLIVEHLRPIIEEYGFFPNASVLKMIGRYNLSHAISKNGGYPKFYRLLGMRSERLFPANDGHYLQSSYECIFDNILFKYNIPHRVHVRISKKYLYKCDFLIGKTYIEIAGYSRTGSDAYEVKMAKKISVYKKLRKKYIILPQKLFCQRIEWIEKEVIGIINRIGFWSIKTSILYNDCCLKPPTYWADFKNIKTELQPFISKYGRMPTIKELYSEGRASMANAIYKYHGTTYDVAQKLKIKCRQVSREYYTLSKTVADYKQLCIDHSKYLTSRELYDMNLRGLAHAIIKYKGFQTIRRKCKLAFTLRRFRGREYSEEQAIVDYRRACIKYKRFLTRHELIAYGFTPLARCLNRHGLTLERARAESGLNFETPYYLRNRYTIKEAVETYKLYCKEYGFFLTIPQSQDLMPAQMIGYIIRTIGFRKMRELTKLKY